MGTNISVCPICKKDAIGYPIGALDTNQIHNCDRCGSFRITEEAVDLLNYPKIAAENYKVSAYLRERSIAQRSSVTIVTSRLDIGDDIVKIKGAVVGVDDILSAFPKTVSERLDRALKNLDHLSKYPGEKLKLLAEKDYSVLFAENQDAFDFFIKALMNTGWIEGTNAIGFSLISLTVLGWNRIAELERQKAGKDSKQAFVAMWFDNSLERAWTDGFEKAIKDAGYEPMRVDLIQHNEKICDIIIAKIRKSRFMVADFTGHRGGVYYEAGFAKGLGIEVIWTCREDFIDKSHFDTRQYNHIVWKDEKDLYEKLLRRIEATIAAG